MNSNATIVIEIPASLKPLADAFVSFAEAVGGRVARSRGGGPVDYAEVERDFAARSARVEAAAHAAALAALDIDAPRIEVGGKTYSRIARSPGRYGTLAGEVIIERSLYREAGVRNGATVDTIRLRTGAIADGWLPQTARAMAYHLQQGTSRDAEMLARETGRLPYSRSSFERVPHHVGDLMPAHQAWIEDDLIRAFEVPAAAVGISAGIDRVSIPVEEPRARPPGRPGRKAPKRPVSRAFRMAYCGSLTLHDANGDAIHTIRYGCMPKGDSAALANAIANDLYQILQERPDLRVALLADGAPEMWALLEGEINRDVIGKTPRSLIDFWHVVEKLAPAARAIYGEGAAAALARWKDSLKRKGKAAARILEELEASGQEDAVVDSGRPVHEAITYLRNHGGRMKYAAARRLGLPIGSGNTEATCKSLVAVRMKRAGSRWKEETGEHILRLRAWALSDRWEGAMDRLLATQRTSVRRIA